MRNTLTWLHISDIHFCSKTEWRDSEAREALLDYLKKIFNKNESLRPDFIFCTGDIAFGEISASPLSTQYEDAITFFDSLLYICGKNSKPLSKKRLFTVPGNHDVNRKKVDQNIQYTLQNYATNSTQYVSKINQYINDCSLEFKNCLVRLEDYTTYFIKKYLPHQYDEEGRLCFGTVVDLDGLTIGIAGFNSAWSCAGPEDDRHLWLPAHWQFNYAIKKIKKAQIRLGIIHHPLDWLNESDQQFAIKRLSKNFHFWLHGHIHSAWVTPVNSHIIIAAGAMGTGLDTEFGINIVQLDLLHSKGVIYLHTYSPSEGGWKPLTISGHAENGQWDLTSLPFELDNAYFISSISGPFNTIKYMDDISDTTTTKEQFIKNIDSYSENLAEGVKQSLIEDIISNAWDFIVFDPFLGDKIFSKFANNESNNIIVKVLLPLCKISNSHSLNQDDLKNIFSIFSLNIIKTNDAFKLKCIILFLKLIKHIVYNKENVECIKEISERLTEIREINKELIDKFCTDIYFRNKCDFVDLPDFFHEQIKSAHDSYIVSNKTTPLARLSPMILSPLQTILSQGFNSILSELDLIATQCSDATECRWTLIAWMRIIPLSEDDEDNNEFYNNLRIFINKFNKQIISQSSFFQYSYLVSLLNSFIETKNIEFLVKYEQEFIRRKSSIRLPQVLLLQLEYASCLYIFCQYNDVEAIASLKMVHLARDNQIIIHSSLFKNTLLPNCAELQGLQQQFSVDQKTLKKSVFQWLILYTNKLSTLFAKPLIERNHTNLRYIKAAVKVYQNRPLYVDSIIKSLKFFYNNISQCSPSFCAKSCFCFGLIGKQQELVKAYIKKALLADDYSIIRNAKHIARCLYSLRHYTHDIDLTYLSQLEKKFYEVTRIGISTPKFFWIYYATGQLNTMKKEYNFVHKLGNALEEITHKAYQLKLKHNETFSLTLSDNIINFIQKSKEESIVAAVLNINLTNAETWNQLGTAVFDNRQDNEQQSFKIACNFYTAAKCFARENREYDAKYCFNYIRCKSNYYLKSREKAESFFIHDTLHYLRQPITQSFFYGPDCVIDFFEVINRDWNDLGSQLHQKIEDTVNKVSWLKKLNPLKKMSGI